MNVTIILVFWMVFRFPYIFKPTNKTDEKNHFQFRNRQFIQHLFMNTIFLWYENVWTFMGVNYVAFVNILLNSNYGSRENLKQMTYLKHILNCMFQ